MPSGHSRSSGQFVLTHNRRNWSTGYLPIDGDSVQLQGQNVRSSILTRRFASIDFGGATTFDQTGGLIGATTIAGANALTYQLDKAAQFHLGGHTGAQGPLIDVVNGLFYNLGTVTQGVSVSGANFARLILATTGEAFTLAAGQTLTLTGGNVLCGVDGTDGGAASITFAGTVNMNAASGALPQIREFRSGMWGEVGGGSHS